MTLNTQGISCARFSQDGIKRVLEIIHAPHGELIYDSFIQFIVAVIFVYTYTLFY